MPALKRIQIHGFKLIREADVQLNKLDILIRANGSGKSNFISTFRLLHEFVNQRLGLYVAKAGGVNTFLHFGQKEIERLQLHIDFAPELPGRSNGYECALVPSHEDTYIRF